MHTYARLKNNFFQGTSFIVSFSWKVENSLTKRVIKMKKKFEKSALVAIFFFRMGPKIFPEKIFKREIFPANLKGLTKITKGLECL